MVFEVDHRLTLCGLPAVKGGYSWSVVSANVKLRRLGHVNARQDVRD